MKYEELNEQEIEEYEKMLIEKADKFWIEMYGKQEASDVDKLRLLARQGKLQDVFQHDIMVGYFKKKGFWRDGKTTLEERKIQLAQEKEEFGKKINHIKAQKIQNIDEIIQKAQKKKEELNKIPTRLYEKYNIDKKGILEKLTTDLDILFKDSEAIMNNKVNEVYQKFLNDTKNWQNSLIDKAKVDLEALQKEAKRKLKNEIESFSAELEAEMNVVEYAGKDELFIEKYNEDIKAINRELNELNDIEYKEATTDTILPLEDYNEDDDEEVIVNGGGLENLTVKELKTIADASNIKYDAHIRKAELIELLKV